MARISRRNSAPRSGRPLAGRLLAALAALLIACAVGIVIYSQPPEARVAGICRDATTGAPLADVDITLDRKNSGDSDNRDDSSDTTDNSPPSTWTQGSDDDSSDDLAGADNSPRSEWHMVTDDDGKFAFPHVPAGEYTLDAVSDGHTAPEQDVVVIEGQEQNLGLSLAPTGPSLSFTTSNFNWMPTENPTIALQGLLQNRSVTMVLERVNLDKTAPPDVSDLASGDANLQPSDSEARAVYAPVRKWVHAVRNADKEGSFYDRIALATDGLPAGSRATLPPGLYRVLAKTIDSGQYVEARTWAVVTDIAIVSKNYGSDDLVYVADLGNGKPMPGVSVAIYNQATGDKQKVLSQAVSGADGVAHLNTAGAAEESSGIVFARSGSSVCALDIDLNSPGSEEAGDGDSSSSDAGAPANGPSLRSFIYTERPVYRPGQTAFLKGIMRLYDRAKGFTVPSNMPVTLDIRDAQDTLISHQVVKTNDMGSWTASVPLSTETLTGEYTIRAELAGQHGTGVFYVAAYQKPQYQAVVSFSKDRYVRGDTIQATITATYYYGAPVTGATAFIDVSRSSDSTDDGSGQPMHVDDDSDSGEPVQSSQVVLDGNGQAHVAIPTKDQPQSQNDTTYTVNVSIEEAGQNVSAQGTATVAQGDFSLAVQPAFTIAHKGDTVPVTVAATGANSKPSAGQQVTLTAEYQSWDWRTGQEHDTRVSTTTATTGPDGAAHYTVTATEVGLLALTATATDSNGNRITDEEDVWVPGAHEEIDARYSDLALVLDKSKYRPGDTAHLLINTDHPGTTALVTIEGSTLYHYQLVPLAGHSTAVDIPVELAFAPSVTISACCVANKQFYQSTQDLVIDDPRRPLLVSVQADKPSYHPGDPALIRIRTTDRGGHPRPAEVSVGVVDSAVYAIQPEPPGTILEAMEPDQGDAVQTADSCETMYYGDVDKGSTDIDIRRRFPDTALWKPDIETGADGAAQVALKLPDTLTTWRITCYGQTPDTMVGKGVSNMVVTKDLLILLETPAFLTAGNQTTLVAVVHNNTAHPLTTDVRLTAQGVRVLSGSTSPTVTVAPGVPTRIAWKVQADNPGQGQMTVTARAGVGRRPGAAHDGALSDGVEQDFPVEPHGAIESAWHAGSLRREVSETVDLDPKAMPNSTVLRVRLSPSIASSLLPAVDYLASYPYGCTDATVSALVPDAILAGAGGAQATATSPAIMLTDAQKATLRDQVQRSLLRLYRLQRDDGGWGWFITDNSDLWMTSDAVWGLELAKSAGFAVNPSILKAGIQSTANLANSARSVKQYVDADPDALALSALALADSGDKDAALGNARWLEKMWSSYQLTQDNQDIAMVALAEWTAGGKAPGSLEQERAIGLMTNLWSAARITGSECSWTAGYHSSPQGVGEDMPDSDATAWCLLAAETITPSDPRIEHAARWLIENRAGDHWDDPCTTSSAVLALAGFLRSAHEMQPDFDASLSVNGIPQGMLHFGAASIYQPDRLIEIPGTALKPGANTVSLKKVGAGRLYYSLELRQCLAQPKPAPPLSLWARLIGHLQGTYPPKLAPSPSGFRIRRAYLRLTSRRNFFWEDSVPAPDTSYQKEDDILVRLIIDCARPATRVVIEEPIPSGCRVLDANSENMEDWDNWWDYTDVRDDRIVFFVRDLTAGEHEIDYHLQAETGGEYDIMPPMITSMVDPTLTALGPTSHIDIQEPGS